MSAIVPMSRKLNMSIRYLDQAGNPMLADPTVDSVPNWSNANPTIESLAVSADGLSATATPLTPGNDVVNLSVTIGGAMFRATLAVEVAADLQVLTSVEIVHTVE